MAVYQTGTGARGRGTLRRECGDLGHGGARSWGRGDMWDGDCGRQIRGHGGREKLGMWGHVGRELWTSNTGTWGTREVVALRELTVNCM